MTSVADTHSDLGDPVFVLSTARAGSTLMSFILDAHPDLCCPVETNLSFAFAALDATTRHIRAGESEEDVAASVIALCRVAADAAIGTYARSRDVKRWCDKSLPNVDVAGLLLKVFPNAKFVCLYRNCRDTIASLMDACPWGYVAFGVGPYVSRSPENLVQALGRYWSDKTERALSFARDNASSCYSIRYEDLATRPVETCEPLFKDFLELRWSHRYIEPKRVFSDERKQRRGPGDVKIAFTDTFKTTSIGRGWRIPVNLFSPPLRAQIDKLSDELGYSHLDKDIMEGLSIKNDETLEANSPTSVPEHELPLLRQETVANLFESHVAARMMELVFSDALVPLQTVKVAVVDQRASWILDFAGRKIRQSDGPTDVTLLTDSETLLGLASGEYNPGIALIRQEVQVQIVGETEASDTARREHLNRVMQVIA